jgi:hypothetical protein
MLFGPYQSVAGAGSTDQSFDLRTSSIECLVVGHGTTLIPSLMTAQPWRPFSAFKLTITGFSETEPALESGVVEPGRAEVDL